MAILVYKKKETDSEITKSQNFGIFNEAAIEYSTITTGVTIQPSQGI